MGRLSSKSHRTQDAVLWEAAGVSTFNRPQVLPPVDLKVRWEEKLRTTPNTQNEVVVTEVEVWVDREIPIGSIMWLGHKGTLPSPVGRLDFFKVMFRETIPNVKGSEFEYRVLLSRYSQTLPELA